MTFTAYTTLPTVLELTPIRTWPLRAYSVPTPPPIVQGAAPTPAPWPGPAMARDERRPLTLDRAVVRFAGWEFDLVERRLVAPGGGTVRIPGLEFALLKTFVAHARRPLARGELAQLLARDRGTRLSDRSVDSYVSRLRRRLQRGGSTKLISTIGGVGYRFDADVVRM